MVVESDDFMNFFKSLIIRIKKKSIEFWLGPFIGTLIFIVCAALVLILSATFTNSKVYPDIRLDLKINNTYLIRVPKG